MWKIFHTSLEWLNEGMHNLLWNDKQLCYSHAIWIEDEAVSLFLFAHQPPKNVAPSDVRVSVAI